MAKVGVAALVAVVLSRMETLLVPVFPKAKSDLPSPLKSLMLTDWGKVPVGKVTGVAKVGVMAPMAVVLSRMEALALALFAVAKSGFPSPLMSPTLTLKGPVPVGKANWREKVGVGDPMAVVLSRMEAVFSKTFAVAKSSFPSLLKSPMLTDWGHCQ